MPYNKSSVSFLGVTINAGIYEDIQYYIWIILLKVILIVYLLIWFFHSLNWWRYAILVPLTIELIKLSSFFLIDVDYYDEIDYLYSLPITLPIIIIFMIICHRTNKSFFYYEIDNEVNEIFFELSGNFNYEEVHNEYKTLKKTKKSSNDEAYLQQLFEIKNKIYNN